LSQRASGWVDWSIGMGFGLGRKVVKNGWSIRIMESDGEGEKIAYLIPVGEGFRV
jgi:hypothetical protein